MKLDSSSYSRGFQTVRAEGRGTVERCEAKILWDEVQRGYRVTEKEEKAKLQ